jgi:hypothetical protein
MTAGLAGLLAGIGVNLAVVGGLAVWGRRGPAGDSPRRGASRPAAGAVQTAVLAAAAGAAFGLCAALMKGMTQTLSAGIGAALGGWQYCRSRGSARALAVAVRRPGIRAIQGMNAQADAAAATRTDEAGTTRAGLAESARVVGGSRSVWTGTHKRSALLRFSGAQEEHMTSRRARSGAADQAVHGIDRMVRNVEGGRFERSLSALTAAGALVTAAEIYFEHDSASFGNKMMWVPVVLGPVGAVAGVAGFCSRQMAKPALPIISAAIVANGVQGFYLHARGIGQEPGGWRNARYNLEMGPPLLAPLLVTMVGAIGLLAAILRREQ